jgi:hypothetical protein
LALVALLFVAALGSALSDGGPTAGERAAALQPTATRTPTATAAPTRTATPSPTPTAGVALPLLTEREQKDLEQALERARKELERLRRGNNDGDD